MRTFFYMKDQEVLQIRKLPLRLRLASTIRPLGVICAVLAVVTGVAAVIAIVLFVRLVRVVRYPLPTDVWLWLDIANVFLGVLAIALVSGYLMYEVSKLGYLRDEIVAGNRRDYFVVPSHVSYTMLFTPEVRAFWAKDPTRLSALVIPILTDPRVVEADESLYFLSRDLVGKLRDLRAKRTIIDVIEARLKVVKINQAAYLASRRQELDAEAARLHTMYTAQLGELAQFRATK